MALAGPWANLTRCQHEAGSDSLRGGWVIAAGDGRAAATAVQHLPTEAEDAGFPGSWLCSAPPEIPTNPYPSAPACPHPHPGDMGAAGDVPALGMALRTRRGQSWHREAASMEVPGWRCPVAHGFLCPMAEPLAVLRNEPGATRAAMREPCSLLYSHIGAPLILWGQCHHRDNSSAGPRDLEMVNISLIAGWAGRCIQDAQEHQRHRMVLPGSTRDPSAPWYLPQATGDPDSPVPPGQRGSPGRGQILAGQCRGLRTGEQWGGKTVTSNWCPGRSFHADAVLWVRKLLVSQEHRRQI